MRSFRCDHCGQTVFFDDTCCLRCGSPLGYDPARRAVVALAAVEEERLVEVDQTPVTWKRCATAPSTGCNWLVRAERGGLCRSCTLTRTRPADGDVIGTAELVRAEAAKRRLLDQLAGLGLPIEPRRAETATGLAFDLLSSVSRKVVTGHDDGVITLDLAEADDEHREHLRRQLAEPYRTLLGHFRHEIGHYYWPRLTDDDAVLDACRTLFGDDRLDYSAAVKAHYAALRSSAPDGAPPPWQVQHISLYAAMHPYEDWAETFADYLHILDTIETAASFGLGPAPAEPAGAAAGDPTRPSGLRTWGEVVDRWLDLARALNEVNRAMGLDDLYPFVLAPMVVRKLAFVDAVVRRNRDPGATTG